MTATYATTLSPIFYLIYALPFIRYLLYNSCLHVCICRTQAIECTLLESLLPPVVLHDTQVVSQKTLNSTSNAPSSQMLLVTGN